MKKLVILCLILGLFSSCGVPSSDQGRGTDKDPNAGSGEKSPGPTSEKTTDKKVTSTGSVSVPYDNTLTLTIPKIGIEEATVPTAIGTDEQQMRNNTAIHLEGTGYPWEAEANVYIVGIRGGYEGEPSYKAFYNVDALEEGDKVYVTDANGQEYSYEIYTEFDVAPTDLYVLDPAVGKNIITLQTCTLPYCDRRIIIQGELDYDSVPALIEETTTGEQYKGTDEAVPSGAVLPQPDVLSGAILPQPDVSTGQPTDDLTAQAEEAAEDYYRAAGSQDWDYTYDALDSETQALFSREEWDEKNQWLSDNYPAIYNIETVELDETAQEPLAEVAVRLTDEAGSSWIRNTYFVNEDGEWLHRFAQEEIDLFEPGVPFEEWVQDQGGATPDETENPEEGEGVGAERARSFDAYKQLLEDPGRYSGTAIEAVGKVVSVETSETKSAACMNLAAPAPGEMWEAGLCTRDVDLIEKLGQLSSREYVRVQGVFEESVPKRYQSYEIMLLTLTSIESVDEATTLDPAVRTFRQLSGSSGATDSGQ